MALQVWLPLDGRIQEPDTFLATNNEEYILTDDGYFVGISGGVPINNGLDDTEFTVNSIHYGGLVVLADDEFDSIQTDDGCDILISGMDRTEGKTASTALQIHDTDIRFTVDKLVDADTFSVAFWYKAESDSSIKTNWNKVLTFYTKNEDGTSGSMFRFESSYASSSPNTYALSVHNNTSQSLGSIGHQCIGPMDEWHHVCFVHTPELNSTYLDGELIRTGAGAAGTLTGFVRIAGKISGTDPYGLMNDLRIYDHELSLKEVKELSKALVAHYPLNDKIGNPNLCRLTYTEADPFIWTSSRADGYKWVPDSYFEVKPSTNYIFSFCTDGTLSNAHGMGGIPLENKPCTGWLYISNDGTTKNWQAGQYDNPYIFTTANHDHVQIGNRHIWTYTTTETQRYMSIRVNNYSDDECEQTIKYWDFKIEEGSVATQWIPNETTTEYAELGLDEDIVYDCSGYGNNLFSSDNPPAFSSDSPRYSSGMYFEDGRENFLYKHGFIPPIDQITMTCWIKGLGVDGYKGYHEFLNIDGRLFEMGIAAASGGTFRQGFYVNGTRYVNNIGPGNLTRDLKWHLLAATFDGEAIKRYVDGELVSTVEHAGTLSGGVERTINVGRLSSTEGYADNQLYQSDIRIYATALSAEDIKELYEVSASIDQNGNTWAYELVEE